MIAWVGWVDRLGCVAVGLVALGCVGVVSSLRCFAWVGCPSSSRSHGFFSFAFTVMGLDGFWIGIVPGFGSRGFAARMHWVLSPVEFCGWRGRVLSRYFAIAWIG